MSLHQLSTPELKDLHAAVVAELKEREMRALEKARADIHAIAAAVNMTPADLVSTVTKRESKKAPVKYRDPSNPANEWTGRGRAPAWADAMRKAGTFDTAKVSI